jgi:hypothetical protein
VQKIHSTRRRPVPYVMALKRLTINFPMAGRVLSIAVQ